MKMKIKMTKRLMIVICIIVAALSFMGGMIYTFVDYVPIVEYSENQPIDQTKYTYDFTMPVDYETASMWIDWADSWHQFHIDREIFTEDMPLEFHQASIDMYNKIKVLFLEFEEEYYIK